MLGVLTLPPGAPDDAADRLLEALADRLRAEGVALAGAVQDACRAANGCRTEMRVRLLDPGGGTVVISQALGTAASGCRLDPGALEQAAQRLLEALPAARLVLLSKFSRQEAAGRGFRPVVAEALGQGLPVLLAVSADVAEDFARFADGMAEAVPADAAEDWCRRAVGLAPAPAAGARQDDTGDASPRALTPAAPHHATAVSVRPAARVGPHAAAGVEASGGEGVPSADGPPPAPPDTLIDARDLLCPLPVLRLRRALNAAAPGAVVTLLATDPAAVLDVPHFCAEAGHALLATEARGDARAYRVRRGGTAASR